ncbi:hydroxymethylglutaryl-CoA synthase [Leucobacter sp. UCMA 4100]|uniref:hydroxymethylglutaryl-CoA synthase n=1 Tax=Leucobacter TaxID=55968 RepID=UPI001C23CC32|nr:MULTISPECIES: hydroxymethylglutaryl-CoA synthase [Leucobacter]MDA3148225.1 hydroxymethylglutaryl-CoA synthase [Leucobacter sp. UCMA 4100]
MKIGIHDIAAATGSLVLDLAEIATNTGTDLAKFHRGIGQFEMSINTVDEDIVTMAARAAKPILDRHGSDNIRTILFATESGVDQSKSAGVFLHGLLGLPGNCRVVELKEACYSATAALQFAVAMVARKPEEKVLVIASDIARYELDSSGEPTQGGGAVAMLVSADPALFEIEPATGLWTSDVMDFWRPNDRSTAVVDGHYSMQVYLDSVGKAWSDFQQAGGNSFDEIDYFCYHQPFTRMAVKAHRRLTEICEVEDVDASVATLEPTMIYNRRLGNSYTASVFFALLSLLDNSENLAGKRVGLFSYGSGAVAEFFTGIIPEGYEKHLRVAHHAEMLDQRTNIDYADYRARHAAYDELTGSYETERQTNGDYRFAGVVDHKRQYRNAE